MSSSIFRDIEENFLRTPVSKKSGKSKINQKESTPLRSKKNSKKSSPILSSGSISKENTPGSQAASSISKETRPTTSKPSQQKSNKKSQNLKNSKSDFAKDNEPTPTKETLLKSPFLFSAQKSKQKEDFVVSRPKSPSNLGELSPNHSRVVLYKKQMQMYRVIKEELREQTELEQQCFLSPEERAELDQLEKYREEIERKCQEMLDTPSKHLAENEYKRKQALMRNFPDRNWDEFYFGIK